MQRTMLALSVRNALMAVMSAACVIGYTNAHAQDSPAASTNNAAVPVVGQTAAPTTLPSGSQDTSGSADKKKATDLNAISVTGQLGSLFRSQATKQDANGVVDSVSAEEAGKFPDQNVADALQRVPGVSVDRSGGESNQITVRGFGPTLVNVLVNGREMATASTDRAFNFVSRRRNSRSAPHHAHLSLLDLHRAGLHRCGRALSLAAQSA